MGSARLLWEVRGRGVSVTNEQTFLPAEVLGVVCARPAGMMLGPKFTVDVSRVGAMAVVAPHGEVDLATVGAVRHALRPGEVSTRVVLDLRQVEFMDSAGLALIVEQMRRAEQDGFDFAVVRGPDQVQRLLRMAGLAERLVVLDDVPGARDAGADR